MSPLDETLARAQPVRARIRESARVGADEVEHRFELSAHHIAAARLGVELEGEYRSNPALQSALTTDQATVDTASLTLALASGLTALNLCADAVMWWTGANRSPDLAYDMNSIRASNLRAAGLSIPDFASSWRDRVLNDATWRLLHTFHHTPAPRSADRTVITDTPARPREHTVASVPDRAVTFAEARWWEFWTALG
jgi:hypothetical protein